jgi:hypothetical protein
MATVTLTVQDVSRAGVAATLIAAGASPLLNTSDTFTFVNDGRVVLIFQKTGAATCNVIFDTPGTVDGLPVGQRTSVLTAGSGDAIATTSCTAVGPFPPTIYNTPGTTMLSGFTVSEVTGLSVRVLRVA